MNTRIRAIRNAVGMTQSEFAAKIQLTKNFVSLLETGGRVPSDRTITDICREFQIDEHWLRTGEGEMLVKAQANSAADLFAAAYPEMTETDKALLEAYFALTAQQREVFLQYCLKVSEAYRTASGASGASAIDAEVAAYRAELEAETEAAEKSEALPDTGESTGSRKKA